MQLSDEQIEAAAKAAWLGRFLTPHRVADFDTVSPDMQNSWRRAMRTAAPFLQAPWNLNDQDFIDFMEDSGKRTWQYKEYSETCSPLIKWISRRNASLIPKPVDPRREKILSVVGNSQLAGLHVTDRILAALDAKE